MKAPLYHLPALSRVDLGVVRSPGPGLGNLLFPIARSVIGRERLGGVLIYPTLRQIKVGTLLRGERDARTYGDVLRARRGGEWKDWFRARRLPWQREEEPLSADTKVIRYEGLGRYFHDLAGQQAVVGDWLRANARLKGAVTESYDIGLHVRLGDFQAADSAGAGHSVRQSFDWYRAAHAEAVKFLGGGPLRTVLFSDEDPGKVAPALGIDGLDVDPSDNAITAILNLSRARLVITSRSTFSMWAVYLGGQPAWWDRRLSLADSFPVRPGLDHSL